MKTTSQYLIAILAGLFFFTALPPLYTNGSENEPSTTEMKVPDISFNEIDTGGSSGVTSAGISDIITGRESFSIYGYGVNYTALRFLQDREDEENRDAADLGNTLYVRIKGDWNPGPRLTFHSEISYTANIGNTNGYAVLESFGISPLSQASFPEKDFIQSIDMDHLWGAASFGSFLDLQFGKMPIAWGTGYVFNPTAKTHSAGFLISAGEETPGTIGIIPSISFTHWLALSGYLVFQERSHKKTALIDDADFGNLPYGIKTMLILGPFDLSVSFLKEVIYQGDRFEENEAGEYTPVGNGTVDNGGFYHDGYLRGYYVGFDFAGALWDFGVYGEAALRLPFKKDISNGEIAFDFTGHEFKNIFESCIGFDYNVPLLDVLIRAEYYHYGPGVTKNEDYSLNGALSATSPVQGEEYFFGYLERIIFDYLTVSAGALVNLHDGSGTVFPSLSYDVYNNFQVQLGGTVFWGINESEFNGNYEVPIFNEMTGEGESEMIKLLNSSIYLRCKLSF